MWRIVVGIILIIGVSLAAYLSKRYSPNRDDAKLMSVKQMAEDIPVYPGSEEVALSSTSKDRIAAFRRSFTSNASYEELKRFYVENLTRGRWHLARERSFKDWWRDLGGRELRFEDDEYYVSVEYAGEKADYGWNYVLSVGWRAGLSQ